jgi:hypothetical protein
MSGIGFLNREKAMQLLEEGWEETAHHAIGIPVHPLGELSAFEHLLNGPSSLESIRLRHTGVRVQGVFHAILLTIFSYNAIQAIRHLCKKRYDLMTWCCIIQSLTGIVYALLALSSIIFSNGASCRQVLWTASIGITISSICISIALLQKAYLSHCCNKALLIVGILLIMPRPIVTYIGLSSPALAISGAGCVMLYPTFLPWIKFAAEAPVNIVFSAAFIATVYRQYKSHRSKVWQQLTRAGIQIIASIIICNLVCTILVAIDTLGIISELFFLLDSSITSLLLMYHCLTMAAITDSPSSGPPQVAPASGSDIDSLTAFETTDTIIKLGIGCQTYYRSDDWQRCHCTSMH